MFNRPPNNDLTTLKYRNLLWVWGAVAFFLNSFKSIHWKEENSKEILQKNSSSRKERCCPSLPEKELSLFHLADFKKKSF